MADFRGAFTLCRVRLEHMINRGHVTDEEICCDQFDLTQQHLKKIVEQKSLLHDEQQKLLARLQENFKKYDAFRLQALAIRKSDQWNVARHILSTECVPRAGRVTELLTAMANNQDLLMQEDARQVTLISNISITCSIGLVFLMAFTAKVISTNSARKITEPVAALSTASRELAAGNLTEDIPIPDDDELGQLTSSFNEMRKQLQQTDGALRKAHDELEQRVVERTSELSKANTKLNAEIIQRKQGEDELRLFELIPEQVCLRGKFGR